MLDRFRKSIFSKIFKKELNSIRNNLDRVLSDKTSYNGRVYDYENDQEKITKALSNWFYSTTDDIARVICQADYEIIQYASSGEEKILNDNNIFYDLLDFPNPSMGRMELWYLTWSAVRSLGNAYWYSPKNILGRPAEFYFLYPDYGVMYVKRDTRGQLTGYELDKGFGKNEKFEVDEIIHFKYPTILSSTYGKAPAMHFKEMIDLDLKIKEHANSSIDGGLNISKVISGDIRNDADRQVIRTQLKDMMGSKAKRSFITAFGTNIDVKDLSQSLKDIDYLQALEKTRKQIYAANGVPILDESVNRSVAEVGQYVFMMKTIAPDLKMFADFLNRNIFWKYDKSIWLRFKDVVPSDRKLEAEIAKIYFEASAYTPDEIRQDNLNKPPYDGEIGSRPMASKSVATLEDVVNKTVQNTGQPSQPAQTNFLKLGVGNDGKS